MESTEVMPRTDRKLYLPLAGSILTLWEQNAS
jgi:hypothetical protein